MYTVNNELDPATVFPFELTFKCSSVTRSKPSHSAIQTYTQTRNMIIVTEEIIVGRNCSKPPTVHD